MVISIVSEWCPPPQHVMTPVHFIEALFGLCGVIDESSEIDVHEN